MEDSVDFTIEASMFMLTNVSGASAYVVNSDLHTMVDFVALATSAATAVETLNESAMAVLGCYRRCARRELEKKIGEREKREKPRH